MLKNALLPAAIALCCFGVSFAATGMVITQEGKKFSEKKVSVAVGEEIEFSNNDSVVHNIHSTSKGYEFDLGAQNPGETQKVSFDHPGQVKIRCAIHPKMKLTVSVQ